MKRPQFAATMAAFLFILSSQNLAAEWLNMKALKVAVLDVVSRVPGETIDTATLTEMLQVALVDRSAFQVVERSLIDKILKEQEFQVTGLTDGQAARIGALAGANKVMLVSIAKLSDKYILIVKGIDTQSGILDLTDQVLSYTIDGFIEIFPVLADRLIRKARGESLPAFQIAPKPSSGTPAAQFQPASLEGEYRAVGRNPDGSAYRGTCELEYDSDDDLFYVYWSVGTSEYEGVGLLEGDTLTVEWGDRYPVVYKVRQGGKTLEGTWANGQASETLTR
jgi:hypothetical protein